MGAIFELVCFIILLSEISSGSYDKCPPTNCGKTEISSPFFIPGSSICSNGFQLSCDADGFPALVLSGNEYEIDHIFYQNSSLRVHNAGFVKSEPNCIPKSIGNISLPPLFTYGKTTDLHLFSGCATNLSPTLDKYKYSNNCDSSKYWELAVCDKDEVSKNLAIGSSQIHEVAPVEEGDVSMKADELLRRGFLLSWVTSDCSACQDNSGHCDLNAATSCKTWNQQSTRYRSLTVILATTIPGAVGALFISCLLVTCLIRRRNMRARNEYLLSRDASTITVSKSDIEIGSLYGIPIFSYKELEEATCNFDASKELGDGGFGTVYHGKLRDGREVAIKRLYEHNYRKVEQFMNEIKILTYLKHPNLVSLHGCTSRKSQELLLVYEYISNGTVADHLHGEKSKEAPLPWSVRMKIAVETAAALAYLHKADVIHRDVKTNNILLDHNFCVKVADFGLSRLFPTDVTHISTAPQGTPGYVDPVYHQCYQLTDRSDVYSFGVVLIELISSMPAVDITRHRHEINLANLALDRIQRSALNELIDPNIGYASDPQVRKMTTAVSELAFQCLQLETDMRPSMDEVLAYLKGIQAGEDCRIKSKR